MTLQEQGEGIIARFDLEKVLSPYGEAHVVGNIALGTTTKPDIDIQIYTEMHYEEAAAEIANSLKELGFGDIKGRRLSKSKKYLIMAKMSVDKVIWELDISLTQRNSEHIRDSYQFVLDYKDKINDENRELIKTFKQAFSDEKIKGDNAAYYIYLGVLDHDIKTHTQMKNYLDQIKYAKGAK